MFRIPTFNLLCNVWHNGALVVPPVGPPDIALLVCQLAWDLSADLLVVPAGGKSAMKLRVPAGTDLRQLLSSTGADEVEVPAGSGRYYRCMAVDDVAKGFPNEFRQALIVFVGVPTPLP
jgi:hypothetical protein